MISRGYILLGWSRAWPSRRYLAPWVGLERERLEWAAGMRTHVLASLGSALFMVVSAFGFPDVLSEQHVVLDSSRVTAQVASGTGFNRGRDARLS